MTTNPILQYAQALQDQDAAKARELLRTHRKDKTFMQRARVLDKLAQAKSVPLGSAHAVA
jgi:hypothetical protein